MCERKYDQMLHIKTVGLREWRNNTTDHNRYEPTPYKALDELFKSYSFKKSDQFVDFGCGRGRVSFYIHYYFHIAVTGIEMHEKTFEEALYNQAAYQQKMKHIRAPIRFEFGLAEHYEVEKKDNCFYFFNPFSVKIFKQVVANILSSVEKNKRLVDLILYYPLPEFQFFLKKKTPFRLMNRIVVPGAQNKYEQFLIYRLP